MTVGVDYIVGGAVLILGRKLFWLFTAAVGFIVGLNLASRFVPEQPEWLVLAAALAAGVLGAILAILVQKIAIFVAGFVAGGYLVLWLLNFLQLNLGEFQALLWAFFIVGGIIGAVLVGAIFDLALIFLSSAVGAGMIVRKLNLDFGLQQAGIALVFVVLFAVGIAVQMSLKRKED